MEHYPIIPVPRAFWDKSSPYTKLSVDCRIVLSYLVVTFADLHAKHLLPIDEDRQPYICCPISDVMSLLGCKKDKAIGVLKRLADAKLICKVPQGFGRPDRVYLSKLRNL